MPYSEVEVFFYLPPGNVGVILRYYLSPEKSGASKDRFPFFKVFESLQTALTLSEFLLLIINGCEQISVSVNFYVDYSLFLC